MIHIITDSASDIDQNELENVTVIPLNVTIGGKTYKDGVDITKDEFFQKLEETKEAPQTGLASPVCFQEYFDKYKEAGDEAIVITISSELSGTFQAVSIVAEDYDNVSVIDSLLVTAPQKLLVRRCMDLINAGLSRQEIVEKLEAEKKRIVAFASIATLEYLLKGGRISKSSALIGGIIGIQPIITIKDGKIIAIGKARGSRQSSRFLNEKVSEVGGIDYSMPYAVGYSGSDRTNLMQYIENNPTLVDPAPREIEVVQIGSAVGTHAGPGAVLVTFFAKGDRSEDR